MTEAMLYQVQIKALSKARVRITLVPTWLGRLLRRRTRVGEAVRAKDEEGELRWWWQAIDRYVDEYVEGYIEAAPVLAVEDMSVEQLLLEGSDEEPLAKRRRR